LPSKVQEEAESKHVDLLSAKVPHSKKQSDKHYTYLPLFIEIHRV